MGWFHLNIIYFSDLSTVRHKRNFRESATTQIRIGVKFNMYLTLSVYFVLANSYLIFRKSV